MKKLLLLLLSITGTVNIWAQQFSYIYIQSEKDVPFYVKYYDEMMPRYGKNYTVLSRLAPGPIQIKILFEQNIHPPVNYNILVPEAGERSFMLTKKDDHFILYDLAQKIELSANNSIEDDQIPVKATTINISDEVAVEEMGRRAPAGKYGNPRFKELAPGEVRQGVYIPPVKATPEEPKEEIHPKKKRNKKSVVKSTTPKNNNSTKAVTEKATDKETTSPSATVQPAAIETSNAAPASTPQEKTYVRKPKVEKTTAPKKEAKKDEVVPLPTDRHPVFIAKKKTQNSTTQEPQFLEEISLPNSHSNPQASVNNEPYGIPRIEESSYSVIKGCETSMTSEEFTALYNQWRRQINDEARLKLYSNNQYCLSNYMVKQLAAQLSTDAARYSWLTKIFTGNTEGRQPEQYATMFSSNTYRSSFIQFINEQKKQ